MNDEQTQTNLIQRLKKIEGQIRGIRSMIEDGRYCIDILTQTRASISAIMKVEDIILYRHLQTCVASSMQNGSEDDKNRKIDEIIDIFSKYRVGGN